MATASTAHAGGTVLGRYTTAIAVGIVGGLVGGVAFGVLMQSIGMIPMVAQLVGSHATGVGWLVHLLISAFIGATFGVLFARIATGPVRSTLLGLGYGLVWWVLGGLVIMPAKLGMTGMIFHIAKTQWQSLAGHLIYGLLLGVIFGLVYPRLAHRGR